MRRAICVEGDLCRWRSQCVSRRGTRTSKSGSGTAAKVDSRCALIGGFRSKIRWMAVSDGVAAPAADAFSVGLANRTGTAVASLP